MTKEDFEFIIFESFDHLPSPQAYYEGKRNIFARTRGDFSSGLRSAFDGLKGEANMTDYGRTVIILNGEAIEEIPNDMVQMKFLRNKPRLITHPYKKAIDLLQRTNGRIIGILTKERLESLWPVLEDYLKFLETVPATIDSISNIKHEKSEKDLFRPIISQKNVDELFEILGKFFEPKDQFMNFLKGNRIEGKINFMANNMKLAGIFIESKEAGEMELGTHQETYDFIKQTFLVKGIPIESQFILSVLRGKAKVNKQNFIEIKI